MHECKDARAHPHWIPGGANRPQERSFKLCVGLIITVGYGTTQTGYGTIPVGCRGGSRYVNGFTGLWFYGFMALWFMVYGFVVYSCMALCFTVLQFMVVFYVFIVLRLYGL